MLNALIPALSPTAGNARPLKFGCRLFTMFRPATPPEPLQDEFLKQCLTTGDNNLKSQGAVRSDVQIRPKVSTWEFLTEPVIENRDGWGLASYQGNRPDRLQKSAEPVDTDPVFDHAVERLAAENPAIVMAHLRYGPNRIVENAHPFRHGNWTFLHNGTADGAKSPEIKSVADAFKPAQGTTDTELAFHYFLSKLQNRFGTLNIRPAQHDAVKDTFRETVNEIFKAGQPRTKRVSGHYFNIPGIQLNDDARMQISPTGNFIASDGNMMLASCFGRRLHLGFYQTPAGETDVLLSSEPIQPSGFDVRWQEIPDGHLVAMRRVGKKIELSLEPL